MRTEENLSPDWQAIGDLVCKTLKSYREIAREFRLSDTAIRKKAKALGWRRPDAENIREPVRELSREPSSRVESRARTITGSTVGELTARGRGLILNLMAELEFLNRNREVLSEMVESWYSGDKDNVMRHKLARALDHETRAKSSNALATALAKLNDAAPGKKEQQAAAADTAGQGSSWEGDLDFNGGRPN